MLTNITIVGYDGLPLSAIASGYCKVCKKKFPENKGGLSVSAANCQTCYPSNLNDNKW